MYIKDDDIAVVNAVTVAKSYSAGVQRCIMDSLRIYVYIYYMCNIIIRLRQLTRAQKILRTNKNVTFRVNTNRVYTFKCLRLIDDGKPLKIYTQAKPIIQLLRFNLFCVNDFCSNTYRFDDESPRTISILILSKKKYLCHYIVFLKIFYNKITYTET